MHTGSCLCGAVRFQIEGDLAAADACHCGQCRRQSGHISVSTDVPRAQLTIYGTDRLTWYRASAHARRGFCSVCGSQLFWEPLGQDWIAVSMGAFDPPTGTRIARHIHVADKGDYYEIADTLCQSA